MTEAEVVQSVAAWLRSQGWNVIHANYRARGLDIEAEKSGQRWFIEAKGDHRGDKPNNRLNFNGALGQIVNNRQDQQAKYSIALPDIPLYKTLWNNSPAAGRCPVNSCLFVPIAGNPVEQF